MESLLKYLKKERVLKLLLIDCIILRFSNSVLGGWHIGLNKFAQFPKAVY